jgi:ferric-dicitrate binding protein FerR (iron transport regulator)
MGKEEFRKLLRRYTEGKCNPQEQNRVENWYRGYEDPQMDTFSYGRMVKDRDIILQDLLAKTSTRKTLRLPSVWKVAASIAIIGGLCISTYFYLNKSERFSRENQNVQADIGPGKSQAILKLANGKTISLDKTPNGTIENMEDAKVNKTDSGMVVFSEQASSGKNQNAILLYSELSTPKGGKYSLTLSDGTKVMLNASSSIRFPDHFISGKRVVYVTGEVYFDVRHLKDNAPFVVILPQQQVEVLGTRFTINSYQDEPGIKTTLMEGSVKVSSTTSGKSVVLSPGEQAIISNANVSKNLVNTDISTAWLNDDFLFIDADLPSIMKQLQRWYDVDVTYKTNVDGIHFSGAISRKKTLQEVLETMSSIKKLNFKLQNRTIIINK